MNKHHFGILALAMAWPLATLAQSDAPAEASEYSLETYASTSNLSNGYGNWHEAGLLGHWRMGDHLLSGEIATMKRFGESGRYIGLSDTLTLSPDWFASLSVGAGDGAAYLPDYRIDAFINRKLLDTRQLIATLGTGYYRSPNGHTDTNLSLGATYYFNDPWVVQGEIRFNESSPGKVHTRQQFIAVTWGRDHQTQIMARHGWGDEGYQAIGGGSSLVNFSSRQSQLMLRHWLGPKWGLSLGLERYSNPSYKRLGAKLALFWELP
jgi:YaiO family outer membrane protein